MKFLNRKILPFFLVLIMIASVFGTLSFIAPLEVTAATTTGVVNDGPLNVRSGPGTNYSVIGSLYKGNTVTVTATATGTDGDKWHKITYSSSKTGYVSAKYITLKTTTTPKDTYTAYSPKKQGVTLTSMTVRKTASTSATSIGTFKSGITLKLDGLYTTSSGVKWYRVYTNGQTGYILEKDVKLGTSGTTSTSTSYVAYSPKKQGVTLTSMTVRKTASTSATSIGTFKSGITLKLDGLYTTSSGVKWYRVYTNGQTGYILEKDVKLGTSGTTSTSTSYVAYSPKKQGVTLTSMIVRKTASTSAASIGTFKSGITLKLDGLYITATGVKWYRVYTNGQIGYILEKDVKLATATTAAATYVAYSPKKLGVTLTAMTVRKTASTSAASIGTFKSGITLKLDGLYTTSSGVKWYRVYTNGQIGYILEKDVKLSTSTTATYTGYSPKKLGVTLTSMTVRKTASETASPIGTFKSGIVLKLDGLYTTAAGVKWYRVYTNGQTGYILAEDISFSGIVTDDEFEAMLTKQNFPASYKPYLRNLHKIHPTWTFTAQHTGVSWSTVQTKEQRLGNNLVEPSVPDSWKSKKAGAYNSSTKQYTIFDGRWIQAADHVIAYYMDPRNFLNENEIFQFMDHKYYTSMSKKEYIGKIVSGSFMNSSTYIDSLYNAGYTSKVNPNVLAAMVIMEQGWGGSPLSSGKFPGYIGYYNHFNIGAYTAGGMTAIERGLWWAKGAGVGATSYGRPWNSIERSLSGGVQFYAQDYVTKNQNTYYLKKFNVMNGADRVATHEYMTNVQGAYGEGSLLKKAYVSVEAPLVFRIPVYTNMPSTVAPKP